MGAAVSFPSSLNNNNLFQQVEHGFMAADLPLAVYIDSNGLLVAADSGDSDTLAVTVITGIADTDNVILAELNELIEVAPSTPFAVGQPVGDASTLDGVSVAGSILGFDNEGAAPGAVASNVLGYASSATAFRYGGKERAVSL